MLRVVTADGSTESGSLSEPWRAITRAHLVALVRSGARFENGILVERSEVPA